MNIHINSVVQDEVEYKHINVTLDDDMDAVWCEMENHPRACFTTELLEELYHAQAQANSVVRDYRFHILTSANKSVFSQGGDLVLFQKLIKQRDQQGLFNYMKQSIDVLYGLTMLPTRERIALVQGMAFGGGFEAALACDTIIAEKKATFGFPDRLFNLSPFMGAYSYLIRRIEPYKALKMIKSARTYSAEELYAMGIIDILVEDGEGYDAVHEHIRHYQRYNNSFDAIKHITQTVHPISYDQIMQIGEQWVNSALRLTSRDLGLMEKLAISQQRMAESR